MRIRILRLSTVITALVNAVTAPSFAQPTDISSGLDQVNTGVRDLFPNVEQIALVVMAIVAVIAAVQVFNQWSNGDHGARKSAMQWFAALVFGGVVIVIVKAIYRF